MTNFKMNEYRNIDNSNDLYVGEFFISNKSTNNTFKLMTNLSGEEGFTQVHVMNDIKILSSKHQGKVRLFDSARQEMVALRETFYSATGPIALAKCTSTHFIFLDTQGRAYQMDIDYLRHTLEDKLGEDYQGGYDPVSELSGYNFKLLRSLNTMVITDVCCGEAHSLFLNNRYEVYTLGHGAEGQLGLGDHIRYVGTPKFVNHFVKANVKVTQVSAGHYHSLAVTLEGQLYAWGEGRSGQLGFDRKVKQVTKPTLVQFQFSPSGEQPASIEAVEAGYGHTVVLSHGKVFATGLNNYGQLGLDDTHARQGYQRVEYDINRQQVPSIIQIFTGKYSTFLVDKQGRLFSFGSGGLGHKGSKYEDIPRKVETNVQYRNFRLIGAGVHETIAFSQISLISIYPSLGPCNGGTRVNLQLSGVLNTTKLWVRFQWLKYKEKKEGTYDRRSKTVWVTTPNFEAFSSPSEVSQTCPIHVDVSVSVDNCTWIRGHTPFLLYEPNIAITNITPRCGSLYGNSTTELTLDVDLLHKYKALRDFDLYVSVRPVFKHRRDETFQTLKNQEVARMNPTGLDNCKVLVGYNSYDVRRRQDQYEEVRKQEFSVMSGQVYQFSKGGFDPANPSVMALDSIRSISMANSIFEFTLSANKDPLTTIKVRTDYWDQRLILASVNERGNVEFIMPPQEYLNPELFDIEVNVLINANQPMSTPIYYKYLNVALDTFEPKQVLGGETIYLKCSGIFDSHVKHAVLKFDEVERVVDLKYVDEKTLSFIAPPLDWIKSTKYLEKGNEEDVEIQAVDQEEVNPNPELPKDKPDGEPLSKEDLIKATIEKAQVDPAKLAEKAKQSLERYWYVNHKEEVSVGITLNNLEWYTYNDCRLTYFSPHMFSLIEIPANLHANEEWKKEIEVVYPEDADTDKKRELTLERFKGYYENYNKLLELKWTEKVFLYLCGCNFVPGAYKVKLVVSFESEKQYFFNEGVFVNEYLIATELNLTNLFKKETEEAPVEEKEGLYRVEVTYQLDGRWMDQWSFFYIEKTSEKDPKKKDQKGKGKK